MGKVYAMGDIHGAYKALVQCLERSGFNKEEDTLIQLGDVVDGWGEAYKCVDELSSIKKLIPIKGNHDEWFETWINFKVHPASWLQGGEGTLKSYCNELGKEFIPRMSGYITNLIPSDLPKSHIDFFNKQRLHYRDHENRFFVHGGFDRNQYIDYLDVIIPHDYYWNRDLWKQARSCSRGQKLRTVEEFTKIFIGHTTTINDSVNEIGMRDFKPIISGGVYNLDQGAGWFGKLTIMNVDTEEYFQSDEVQTLYPNEIKI